MVNHSPRISKNKEYSKLIQYIESNQHREIFEDYINDEINTNCMIKKKPINIILISFILFILIFSPLIGYFIGRYYSNPFRNQPNISYNQYEYTYAINYHDFNSITISITNNSYTNYKTLINSTYTLEEPEQALLILS